MAILITSAAEAAAYRLERLLGKPDIIFADQQTLPSLPEKTFIQIPDPSLSSFTHEILKICLDRSVSEIYPLKESELRELSTASQLFEEYGIKIMNFTSL